MRLKRFVALLVAAVLLVATTAWVTAQAIIVTPVPQRVMTGGDLGFRVDGLRGSAPVGAIVVQVNGEWVEAEVRLPRSGDLQSR